MNCAYSSEARLAVASSTTTTTVEARAKVLRMSSTRTLSAAQAKRIIVLLEDVIRSHEGNVSAAARTLGMRQQTVNSICLGAGVGFQSAEAIARALKIPIGVILNDQIPQAFLDVLRASPGRWSESVIAAVSHWPPVRSLDSDQIRAKLDAVAKIVDPALAPAKHRPVR